MHTVGVRMPDELRAELEELAAAWHVDLSAVVRVACRDLLRESRTARGDVLERRAGEELRP